MVKEQIEENESIHLLKHYTLCPLLDCLKKEPKQIINDVNETDSKGEECLIGSVLEIN